MEFEDENVHIRKAKRNRWKQSTCPFCQSTIQKTTKGTRRLKICHNFKACIIKDETTTCCPKSEVWMQNRVKRCFKCGKKNMRKNMTSTILDKGDYRLIRKAFNEVINGYRVEGFDVVIGDCDERAKGVWIKVKTISKFFSENLDTTIRLEDFLTPREIEIVFNVQKEIFIGNANDDFDIEVRMGVTTGEAKTTIKKFSFPILDSIEDDSCWK